MKLLKPKHKSRGSILAAVLGFMAILVTIVTVIHTSQTRAMRPATYLIFGRASLYVPKGTSAQSLERVKSAKYGADFGSARATDVHTGVWNVTTEAWNR